MEEEDNPISQEQQEYQQKHEEMTFIILFVSLFVFCFSLVIFLYYGHNIFFAVITILAYLGLIIPLPDKYNKDDYSIRLLKRLAIVGGITFGILLSYAIWFIFKIITSICFVCGNSS
ncbi:MAG: hypothetical protein IJ143_06725 [Neisseriaceae bacterium]|nr:hypothetical protein [Neisseriaceae bacterium]